MKEITSKRTNKVQIISDDVWNDIVGRGWAGKYNMVPILERKLKEVILPPEIKTTTKKKTNG
jgi:hypothetical protein